MTSKRVRRTATARFRVESLIRDRVGHPVRCSAALKLFDEALRAPANSNGAKRSALLAFILVCSIATGSRLPTIGADGPRVQKPRLHLSTGHRRENVDTRDHC
jgi:hypothetical protein